MRTTAQNKAEADGADEGRMALSGHLRELRGRVILCLAVLLITMAVGLVFAGDMVGFLLRLGERYEYRFVYIAPQELLLEYFAVDLAVSVCVTLPVLLYELWAFLRPGLKRNERLLFALAMVSGLLCAGIGVLFAYRILLPFMLRFLISLSVGSGVTAAVIPPPDVVSQVMVALPLLGLYEVSILLCTALDRLRRRKKADTQDPDDADDVED